MYFYNLIKEISLNNKVILFIDMDGVIASYDFGHPLDFVNKRPLFTNIKKLEKLCDLKNVELHILSVCREDKQIDEKLNWLKKYVPFIKHENVHILSKHSNMDNSSSKMKLAVLKEYKTNNKIALIDDDIRVLRLIADNNSDILLFQDSALID